MSRLRRFLMITLIVVLVVLLPQQTLAAEEKYPGLRQTLITAIRNHEDSLDLEAYHITDEDFSALFYDVIENEPDMWNVFKWYSGVYADDVILQAKFNYYATVEEEQAIRAVVNSALSECIKSGMTDVQKALALHDWLVLHCEYDLTYTGYRAYDAIVKGSSVCHGYALAYEVLMDVVGIDCCLVTSDEMNHAWNLVKIDGEWYHVDCTWDDPLISGMDFPGSVYHDHFLRSDAGIMSEDHYGWETDISCTSTAYDTGMFWEDYRNGVYFLSSEEVLLRRDGSGSVEILRRNLQTGEESLVHKIENSTFEYDGSTWSARSSGLTMSGDVLYFGDLTHIYRMDDLSAEPEVVCHISDLGDWHYFRSSYVENGMLYAVVRSMSSGAIEVRSLKIDQTHIHLWDSGTVSQEPTEDSEGVMTYTCTQCGDTKTETLPVLEHVHSYEETVVAPTCSTSGYTVYTCRCGDSYRYNYVDPLPHTPGEPVETEREDPSCLMDGGHILATYCTECGSCIEEVWEKIPAPGHAYQDTSRAPTCTEYGMVEQTCTVCGSVETLQLLEPLGHEQGILKTEVIQEHSCASQGIVRVTASCKVCGQALVDRIETYEPYPHVPVVSSEWISKEPYCEMPGERVVELSCENCGVYLGIEIHEIPALEHDYRHYVAEPTCYLRGSTTHTCQRCLYSYVDSFVDRIDHSWGDWTQTKDPNYLEDGEKTRSCVECGETETEVVDNNIFSDVKQDRFENAILWAYYEGITTGTGDGTAFSPENACTRKQIVTFLWRAAGEPEPKSMENPFTDVKADRFEKAILWAYYEGITTGTGDGSTFSPENTCTRKQIVTFLWRFYDEPAPKSMENKFVDVKNDRFTAAILWAAEQGITTGTGDGSTFSPEAPCTRKQIVTFLYRAHQIGQPQALETDMTLPEQMRLLVK